MYAARTRFIEESMLQLFAKVAWPAATTSDDKMSRSNKEPINIGMRLRQRWQ